jgi:hypothetical protein
MREIAKPSRGLGHPMNPNPKLVQQIIYCFFFSRCP